MAKSNLGFGTVSALFLAALGVVAPIAWDYYEAKSALELQHLSTTTLVQPSEDLAKVRILYGDKQIPGITRVDFALLNSGRNPIRETDIVAPPALKFGPGSEILEVQTVSVEPRGLSVTPKVDTAARSVSFAFPLLNPSDRIRITVLVTGSTPQFGVSGRIAGVRRVDLVDQTQESGRRLIPWTVYLVGAVTAFLLLAVLGGLVAGGKEIAMRDLANRGAIAIPISVPPSAFRTYLQQVFRPAKTESELRPILEYLSTLPEEPLTDEQRTEFAQRLTQSLNNTQQIWIALFMVAVVIMLGLWYVLPRVL